MEDLNIPIFAQAKVEYTKQLVEIMYPHMYDGVKSIYDEAKIMYATKTTTPIMLLFRELLEKVPIWNSEIIDSECSRIIQSADCDWIDDLITAVFISHTKILTSIGPNQSFQKINVTIPKTSTFIHKSYINVARQLWKNPYLFNEQVPGHEFQRNSKEIEDIIKSCIETTVRMLLPIKEILREHLDTQENDSIIQQKDALQKMLREELKGLKASVSIEDGEDGEGVLTDSGPTILKETRDEDSTDEVGDGDIIGNLIEELRDKVAQPDASESKYVTPVAPVASVPPVLSELPLPDNNPVLPEPLTLVVAKEHENEPAPHVSMNGDPTEAQVQKQCAEIVVNDITLPVDVGTGGSTMGETMNTSPRKPADIGTTAGTGTTTTTTVTPVTEPVYDNATPITETPNTIDSTKLANMQKMLVTEDKPKIKPSDINVIKDPSVNLKTDDLKPDPVTSMPSFSLSGLYPSMANSETKPGLKSMVIPETKPEIKPFVTPEVKPEITLDPKSPRKDIVDIQVGTNDLDETSSLADFFNDVKQIVEDKGIKVVAQTGSGVSLFEDASAAEVTK